MKKQYSVGICTAKGDLSKRWYVWYSYRNPQTGKLERQGTVDTNINIHKTRKTRLEALRELERVIERGLEEGLINPYQTTPNPPSVATQNTNIATPQTQVQTQSQEPKITIAEAFLLVREYAEKNYKTSSVKEVKSRLNRFERWTKTRKLLYIEQITRREIETFLKETERRTSTLNRNNDKAFLQLSFGILASEYIIERNFITDIKLLKTKPKRHKTYTLEQETAIFERLEKVDKPLGLFIKFISYNMLRPIEVCRLQVKSVNLKEKKLYFEAKNKAYKTKIIPDILLKELPDLSAYEPDCYLFTRKGIAKSRSDDNYRRTYWSIRFKKIIKDHFKLGSDYTMYSFRHTFITKLYNELIKQYAPFEAKSRLMLITGHGSMSSLEKYLRDIDAALPEDYSHYLE